LRIIKLALISIVVLFFVTLGISSFIPSHVRLSRAINLAAGRDAIFALLKDTTRWRQWNPAFMASDSFSNHPPIGVQFLKTNDSEVLVLWSQAGHKPVQTGWQLYTRAAPGDSLTLQWHMELNSGWLPWQKMGTLLYESTYGVMMQKGLTNIKMLLEAKPQTP
jgi:hypothetical protein